MADIFKNVKVSEDIIYLNPSAPITSSSSIQPEGIESGDLTARNEQEINTAFTSGFNQGVAEGVKQSNNQMAEQIALLKLLTEGIPAAIGANRLELRSEIADIVLVIVKQFFVNQQLNKEDLAQQINQTINLLNDKQNIELSLHPTDIGLLQQGVLNLDLQECKNLRISPNENLRLGGCIIRSEHGVFDAGIERQIDSLKQALLQIKQGNHRE